MDISFNHLNFRKFLSLFVLAINWYSILLLGRDQTSVLFIAHSRILPCLLKKIKISSVISLHRHVFTDMSHYIKKLHHRGVQPRFFAALSKDVTKKNKSPYTEWNSIVNECLYSIKKKLLERILRLVGVPLYRWSIHSLQYRSTQVLLYTFYSCLYRNRIIFFLFQSFRNHFHNPKDSITSPWDRIN